MSNDPSPHLSTLTLDALHLGGLSPEEEREAQAHLAQCEACALRLANTNTTADRFRQQMQQQTLAQIRERLEQPQQPKARPALRWVVVALATAAAALGAFLVLGR